MEGRESVKNPEVQGKHIQDFGQHPKKKQKLRKGKGVIFKTELREEGGRSKDALSVSALQAWFGGFGEI